MSKTIFEKDSKVVTNYIKQDQNAQDLLKKNFPQALLRKDLDLPQVSESEVVRHYSKLARKNFSLDTNFYPLGSCTMKYNPKLNEDCARLEGFSRIHPLQDVKDIQGALALIYNLEQWLIELTGMRQFTFQGSSGAQGEFIGMRMIRKYHQVHNNKKTKVLIPDSAHGTNPATAAMCGYKTVVVKSNSFGLVDIDELSRLIDGEVAAVMLTNPNTLGLFEERILEISDLVHKHNGFLYYDGANFNPLLGVTKPSLMGFDVIHLNLHKTFATPHGCGGPGAGAVGVGEKLVDFLPVPTVKKDGDKFDFDYSCLQTIGKVRSFYGNFAVLIRAYAYLLRLGGEGLLRVAQTSVINANYIRDSLKDIYQLASEKRSMHEVVFSCVKQKDSGVSALDIAKRLIDYGIHPPTMYFPLIVKEALMVEPTETETKETLDKFIQAMCEINQEVKETPELVKTAPHHAFCKRVDAVKAARTPILWDKQIV